jgi:hypothetical protein
MATIEPFDRVEHNIVRLRGSRLAVSEIEANLSGNSRHVPVRGDGERVVMLHQTSQNWALSRVTIHVVDLGAIIGRRWYRVRLSAHGSATSRFVQ